MSKKNAPVANMSNQLAFNMSWNLSFREWNVILYLISKLDSKNQKTFEKQVIPVKELVLALKEDGKKWGGAYKEINSMINKFSKNNTINFYTSVLIEGKPLKGFVSFFSGIDPIKMDNGRPAVEFRFNHDIKPLLLELNNRFVSIPQSKTKFIKNGHAIRFLIAAKAKRDMMRNHEDISSLRYSLDGFRMLLGIENKYPDIRNFRRAVINKIEKEINERCDFLEVVKVIIHPEHGRPKKEVEFLIADRGEKEGNQMSFFGPQEDLQPSQKELANLSRAKDYAFKKLVEFGITPGIAFYQILPKIGGSEFIGFEDWYVEEALKLFSRKTRIPKSNQPGRAGAFVEWFLKTSFREHQFPEILERVHARKKKLQSEKSDGWANRLMAKDITSTEFTDWYNKQREEKVTATAADSSGFKSLKQILENERD